MKRVVPPNIARLMSAEDRKKHGIETPEESLEKEIAHNEKEEHRIFIDWCRINKIPCRTDRMDKRITGNVGWPDFLVVYGGRVLPIEFKIYGNKLSADQQKVHAELADTSTFVEVCSSAGEAIRKTRDWLWANFRWQSKEQVNL